VETHGKQDQSEAAEGQGAGEGGSRDPVGSPLLDPSDAAVKKLIRSAEEAREAELEQFTLNVWRTPETVRTAHLADELAQLR
jgi:hypothetical protein